MEPDEKRKKEGMKYENTHNIHIITTLQQRGRDKRYSQRMDESSMG